MIKERRIIDLLICCGDFQVLSLSHAIELDWHSLYAILKSMEVKERRTNDLLICCGDFRSLHTRLGSIGTLLLCITRWRTLGLCCCMRTGIAYHYEGASHLLTHLKRQVDLN